MPTRLLREGILDSDSVCSLSFPAEVFYRRLMSVVDDFGRFDARVSVLRSRLYPLQIDKVREADIERWIAECEKSGLIALYSVSGKPYLLFHKLGSPRAKESKFPAPSDGEITSVNGCKQTQTDESERAQLFTSVPYSGSYSGAGSDSSTDSINPPTPQGGVGVEKPPKRKQTVEHPLFAEFWQAYPRKTAKPAAATAFKRIDPTPATLSVMLSALAEQCRSDNWTKDDGQYIPHPATWLNQRRWEDQKPTLKPQPTTSYLPFDKF